MKPIINDKSKEIVMNSSKFKNRRKSDIVDTLMN